MAFFIKQTPAQQLVPKDLLDFESLQVAQYAPIQDQAGRTSHSARHVEDPGHPGRRSLRSVITAQ
jgi:hypothetical protein